MARRSPIMPLHERAEATFLAWGEGEEAAGVVERYQEVEIEYAAIRRGAGLIDRPDRGTLTVTGGERIEFLNNMLTQELKGLDAGRTTRSFWLNRKGRIDADLVVSEFGERMLIDLDVLTAASTAESLGEFVFAEDVEIVDASEQLHRFELHGPRAWDVLATAGLGEHGLDNLSCAKVEWGGTDVFLVRADACGCPGVQITVAADVAPALYEHVLKAEADGGHALGLRPIGWHAYNIARLEAGTPLFHIDFGPSNLPGETALLDDRVSFKKGCYLGQEVVARMQSLGHPKHVLTAVRAKDDAAATDRAWQPETGAAVRRADNDTPIGAVTSSTRSPMLGDAIIALAVLKWGAHEPDTALRAATARGDLEMVAQPGLAFWSS